MCMAHQVQNAFVGITNWQGCTACRYIYQTDNGRVIEGMATKALILRQFKAFTQLMLSRSIVVVVTGRR